MLNERFQVTGCSRRVIFGGDSHRVGTPGLDHNLGRYEVNRRFPIGDIRFGRSDPTSIGVGDAAIDVARVVNNAVADSTGLEHVNELRNVAMPFPMPFILLSPGNIKPYGHGKFVEPGFVGIQEPAQAPARRR